jgi:hypothetical protein
MVLAVTYTQLSAWIAEQDATPDAGAATPAAPNHPLPRTNPAA